MQPPVRYSPDVEAVRPDEGQIIEQLNAAFDKILTRVAEDSGHAVRSVHAKSHGILEGTLTIDADLPRIGPGPVRSSGRAQGLHADVDQRR